MSWTREETLAVVVVLCAALIGAAVMLRDSSITGLVVDEFGNAANLPPAYLGPGSFSTPADTPLTIDLAPLFADPENDALTFLVAEEDQIAVSLSDSLLTLVPASGFVGERTLTIVASDGTNVAREYVRLIVEGAAQPPAEFSTPVEQPPLNETPAAPAENVTVPLNETLPAEENLTNEPAPDFGIPEQPVAPVAKTFALNEQVRDDADAVVGRKTADEPGYETYFTGIGIEGGQFVVRFYHDGPTALPVWVEGNVGAILSTNTPSQNEEVTLAVPLDLGAIPEFRLHIGAESEIFDFGGFGSQEFTVSDVITSCSGTGVVVNTSTSLATNLVSNESCIFINASNLFFNCSGFSIAFGTAGQGNRSGIAVDTETNVTIKDCVILSGSITNSGVSGINLTRTNDSFVLNTTIQLNGTTLNTGIRIWESGHRNTIANNTIDVRSNETLNLGISGGASITSSETMSNNSFIGNRITTNGTSSNTGVHFTQTIVQNILENNTIITTNGTGVNLAGTKRNTISNNNINTTQGGIGIRITESLLIEATLNRVDNNTITTNGFSEDHGIQFVTNAIHNNITRNTVVTNSPGSHAIRINNDANQNNSFTFNNLSARGVLSYAVFAGHNSTFGHNILDNPVNWINVTAGVLTNFTNTTFATPSGSIRFPELFTMNGSQDVTQQRLNTTQNRAFLDGNNLTFLNRSAQVALQNITFNAPRVNVDFEDDGTFAECPSTICTPESFTGSVFTFNVTRFTTYSLTEAFAALSGCATVNQSSRLTQNVSSNGTCIVFGNNSVNLDCANFTITYGQNGNNDSFGINVDNFTNSTIANCVITKAGVTNGSRNYGIRLVNATFSLAENNTIRTNGSGTDDGIYASGLATTAKTDIVTNPGNVNNPECVPQPNVGFCSVCFTAVGGVDCANLYNGGCTDGEGFKTDTILRFNLTAGNMPTSGRMSAMGGEVVYCHLNGNFIFSTGGRNNCGIPNSAAIQASAFVPAENNLTCSVTGSGKDEDNGFKLYEFYYVSPAQRTGNYTIRNNTIFANGANDSRGIFLDIVNSTISNNSIVTLGDHFGHGILLSVGAKNNSLENNTITTRARRSNGIHADGGIFNRFVNNSFINVTGAAVYLDQALNNTFNRSIIPRILPSRSSLFIEEPSGTINYTGDVNLTLTTRLSDVVSITFNRTFVNTTDPGGNQLNQSAILEFFAMPFFDSRPVIDTEDDTLFAACQEPQCRERSYALSTSTLRFNVSSFTTYAASELSSCGELDLAFNVSAETFLLRNNVSTNESCFSILEDNLTLDCDGFTIYYGSANLANVYGINIADTNNTGIRNITVQDCVIVQNGTGSGGHGIRVVNGNLIDLLRNNITTRAASSHDVSVQNSGNVTILGNNLSYSGQGVASAEGIRANFTLNISILGITIRQNASGSGGIGIDFADVNGTVIGDANVTTQGSSAHVAQFTAVRHAAQYDGNLVALGAGSRGLLLENGSNATFRNFHVVGVEHGVFAQRWRNLTLLNVNVTSFGNDAPAVLITNSSNIVAEGRNIATSGDRSHGVLLANSNSNATFRNYTITTLNATANAVLAANWTQANFLNVNASTLTNDSGVFFYSNVSHSLITFGNVSAFGARSHGFLISNSTNITINGTVNGSTIITRGLRAHGILLDSSGNVTMRLAYIVPEDDALRVDGSVIPHWSTHDIDSTNRGLGGGTIQYFGGTGSSPACPAGTTSAAGFYHITLVSCSNAFLTGFNSPEMVTFVDSNGSALNNGQVRNNSRGARVFFSRANIIANSTFTTMREYYNFGVHLLNSTHTNISASTVHTDGTQSNYGIYLQANSHRSNISFSNISTNGTFNNIGILINASEGTSIHFSNISTHGTGSSNIGIALNHSSSQNSTIVGNSIFTNGSNANHGISVSSSFNTITGNNIIMQSNGTANFGIVVNTTNPPQIQIFSDDFSDGTLDPFTTSGNNAWFVNTSLNLAQSGDINDSQSTVMTLNQTLQGAGTISFSAQVSSESGFDFLRFAIDGSNQLAISGTAGAVAYNFSVSSGAHSFTWTYSKDSSLSSGNDAGRVDNVSITASEGFVGNDIRFNTVQTAGTTNGNGIVLESDANGTIIGNTVRAFGTGANNRGIVVSGGGGINISHNRVSTYGTSNNYGVALSTTSDCFVVNNTVHTDGNESYNRGIYLLTVTDTLVLNNNISTNGTRDNNGIDVELVSTSMMNNSLVNNTIRAKGRTDGNKGILINQSSKNRALLNTITTNGSLQNAGIMIAGHSGTAASNNTADFNVIFTGGNESDNHGILLHNFAFDNNMSLNNITTNGTRDNNGIRMDGNSDRNNASNNTIVTSGAGGGNHGAVIYTNFSTSEYNVIERSLINTTGTEINIGVLLQGQVNGNRVRFNRVFANTIRTSGPAGSNYGIRLFMEAPSNVIEANAVNTTGTGNNTGILIDTPSCCEGPDFNDVFANTVQTGDAGGDNEGIKLLDLVGDSGIASTNISNNTIRTNGTVNNHGISMVQLVTNSNVTANRIVTNGSERNYGVRFNGSSSNTFAFINITTNGSQSFGIVTNRSGITTSFRFILMNNTVEWINATAAGTNNFENVTFEENNGSIQIYPAFTLSGRQEVTKRKLNISYNRAFLNSTNLTSMNISAIIVLRNITFLDPVPAVDFNDDYASDVCSFPRCVELSFANEVFTFNVTNFTAYSAIGNVNVTLTKYDSPDPVGAGETLSYRIEINITGNTTAFNVTVNDTYPSEVIFVSALPGPNSGTNNTFSLGNLSNGTSFSINISVTPRSTLGNGTILNNSVNITYQNETGQRPSVVTSELTAVRGPFNVSNISVTKTDAPDPVENGTRLNYTITLSFNGNGTAYNVTVNDTYPAQVIFNSAQPAPLAGTNNTFVLGNVSAGSTIVLNLSVNVSQIANGTVINNTATVTFQNETGGAPSRIATASTTVENVTITPPPPPPPPPAEAGGGGGWTTPSVGGVEFEKPAQIPSQACAESWECEGWSACENGRQVRTCVEITGCNSTQYIPATKQACVMPPQPAQEEPPLAMPELQPERFEPPAQPRWTLCMILPLAIDGALIALAALVLAYLVLTAQKKSRKYWRTILDVALVIVLALLIWQYVACREFLPLQYLVFVILLLSIVLVRLIELLHGWQKAHVFERELDKAKHAAQDAGRFLGRTERRIAKTLTLPKPKALKPVAEARQGFFARVFGQPARPAEVAPSKPQKKLPKLPPAPAPVQMKVEQAQKEGVFTRLFKPAPLQKPVVLPPLPRKLVAKAVPKPATPAPAEKGVWSRLFGPRPPRDVRSAVKHSSIVLARLEREKQRDAQKQARLAAKTAPKPVAIQAPPAKQAPLAPQKLKVLHLPSWLKPGPKKEIAIKPRDGALTGDLKDVFATINRSEKALERLDKTLRRLKKK